jgi:hypothetical protein
MAVTLRFRSAFEAPEMKKALINTTTALVFAALGLLSRGGASSGAVQETGAGDWAVKVGQTDRGPAQWRMSPAPVATQQKGAGLMSYDEYAKGRHSSPYVIEIQVGEGALLYFGAQHINDPKHSQVTEIEKQWRQFHPTLAFNEGGDPPVAQSVEEAVSRHGEAGLTRFLAARDKVPVRSLEPGRADEVAMLLKTYTPEQVKVFYALRQVPQFYRSKHDEPIETYMDHELKRLTGIPGLEGQPRNFAELEKSCLWLSPRLREWREAPQSWFSPMDSQAYTNQVSRLTAEFRDQHMVKLLVDEVKQEKKVFAVVGFSHVVMQESVLRAALRSK